MFSDIPIRKYRKLCDIFYKYTYRSLASLICEHIGGSRFIVILIKSKVRCNYKRSMSSEQKVFFFFLGGGGVGWVAKGMIGLKVRGIDKL